MRKLLACIRRGSATGALALAAIPLSLSAGNSIPSLLSDGFDFPVGHPDAYGYYVARGYQPNGHLGEDWNGRGGGNSDDGDPVYAIANGVVVYSGNFEVGWGNVIILRHAYRNTNGRIQYVDSLYGHLGQRRVELYEPVRRGQQIGTIGTNNGMYWAHLHFELRKNIDIGMSRSKFAQDYSNYYSPSSFIKDHRSLQQEFRPYRIPVDTFNSGRPSFAEGSRIPLPKPIVVASLGSSSEAMDDAVMRILERNKLIAAQQAKNDGLRTAAKQSKPAEVDEVAQLERDKIRSFWGLMRNRMSGSDASGVSEPQ